MSRLTVFYRLLGRPLLADPLRTALTVFAVALGVAVVVAIDLAGEASAGSFQSSMETLTGEADLEISAVGGVEERILGDLVRLPYNLEFSPRVEGFAIVEKSGATVPVFGLDLIGDATLQRAQPEDAGDSAFDFEQIDADNAAWVGYGVADEPGGKLRLQINDRFIDYTVAGVLRAEGFRGVSVKDVVILDIAAAQRALDKLGRLDRIQVYQPDDEGERDWQAVIQAALPAGVEIAAIGSAAEENKKMLGAFRWNLRVLSYLSLIVGAFLIYNTIAVSVVRRRPEIGVLRALGATRQHVRWAFLVEAAVLGAAGTVVGLLLGRILANGAVELMSLTVQTLYVTSAPGEIAVTLPRLLTAALAGIGVALLAAWIPAKEAAEVPPTEAMARGRRDFDARQGVTRRLAWAGLVALAAGLASLAPPVANAPLFGYLAAVLLLASSALAAPWFVKTASQLGSRWAFRLFGIEGFLGSRSVAAALARTAILVGALSTATAMLVSIGVMVGSFRETVMVWMDRQLRADLFIRPAGDPATDRYPTMDVALADAIEAMDEVEAVDRFRAYPIRYNGLKSNLGAGDAKLHGQRAGIRFLQGGPSAEILTKLTSGPYVVVSEPFARKHNVWTGDTVTLPLGGEQVELENLGVFYDYTSERGAVIIDRQVLLRYLPDPNVSSLAIYLKPGADPDAVQERIFAENPTRQLYIATNGKLRREAIAIFDRTFAITWALEAVAVTVAVLGMAGALLALVIDRKREIAVLRFLGASSGQIRKLILTESGLLGLMSIVLGTALGTVLSLVLIYVINKQSFGWTIQFHWPVGLLLLALGGVYAASVAAGLYPARLAARLNPIEAAHEE